LQQLLLIHGYYKRVGLVCKAKDRHELHELALKEKKEFNVEYAKENII